MKVFALRTETHRFAQFVHPIRPPVLAVKQVPETRMIGAILRLKSAQPDLQAAIQKAIHYFQINADRMRYARFRRQGLFVGSGVVEAGCKMIVGQRLKQSGMRWTVRGANAIIALRCLDLSNQWEDFWESRRAS